MPVYYGNFSHRGISDLPTTKGYSFEHRLICNGEALNLSQGVESVPTVLMQARPRRAITNENDENSSTRLTRAKAAAGLVPEDAVDGLVKKPLGSKRAINAARPTAKRTTLGDISNVARKDNVDPKSKKAPLAAKSLNTAALKPARANSARRALKDDKPKSVEPKPEEGKSSDRKRSAASADLAPQAHKKRNTGSARVETKAEPKSTALPAEETTSRAPIFDLDAEDLEDPGMVAEYVVEIFDHLRQLEGDRMANPDYMSGQTHLEWNLRGVLIDWLIEVHTRFHLLPETLFLAVNIIDRFLSQRIVELEKLQLVGITAMFIASKYEEVLSPHVQNFKHVADDGFSEEEILKAERFMLATLNYDLSYPNPMNFLRRISKADAYDIQTRTLGKYLLEISLLDHRFLPYTPSHLSAAAMYLARLILERGAWNATIAYYAGYTEAEIMPVFRLMVDYLQAPVLHEAFFKKYASKKFLKASILTRQWAKKNYALYLQDTAEQGKRTNSGTKV